MLGNLINRYDAVRLYHRLHRRQVRQIADRVRTPGPQRVMNVWPASGHDFTYAACSALAAPVPDTRAIRRRDQLRPGYDTT